MIDNTPQYVSIGIASIALVISLVTFYKTHVRKGLDWVDSMLFEIWQIVLTYPKFNDPGFTNNYQGIRESDLWLQYDAFSSIIWNFFESIYERGLHKKDTVVGIFEFWVPMHQAWYLMHKESYSDSFNTYIESHYLSDSED